MNQTSVFQGQLQPVRLVDLPLLVIVLIALGVRLLTFNGAFGSDDLVYYERAAQIANGEWTTANYNGALRYGFNIPAGGMMALFGDSLFAANLWPLLSSLIEVAAVYVFANAVMNQRAAVYSALLLSTAPLHMAVATRIHADPVVAMFVTLAFVLTYFGASRRRPGLLLLAGLCIGCIYWTKELAAVVWLAFLPLMWLFKDRLGDTVYVIVGVVVMMLGHGILMTVIAGNPFHLVEVVLSALKRNFVDAGQGEDAASYYLRYLFLDVRHTGLLAFFAVFALLAARMAEWRTHIKCNRDGYAFLIIWLLSLITVLSIFPVSLSPLRWTLKQSNYITLFLAPIALLAGFGIAAFPRLIGQCAIAICVAVGVLLGSLQQADYRAFTANTKSLVKFATQHPGAVIVGSTNNSSLGGLWSRKMYAGIPSAEILAYRDFDITKQSIQRRVSEANEVFAVLDRQTALWFSGKSPVTQALPCWRHVLTLGPIDLSYGNQVAGWMAQLFSKIPTVSLQFSRLAQPANADIYRVNGKDVFCGASKKGLPDS